MAAKAYKYRVPMECQNGHRNFLYFELHRGEIRKRRWGDAKCDCPKHELHEGYSPIGSDQAFTGMKDENGVEVYDGDVVLHTWNKTPFDSSTATSAKESVKWSDHYGSWYRGIAPLWGFVGKIEVVGNRHRIEV